MNWISCEDEPIPYGLNWVTIGWQHYAGETTVGLVYNDGEGIWDVGPRNGKPSGRDDGWCELRDNWQAYISHWAEIESNPEPFAAYVLRDGRAFDARPTYEDLTTAPDTNVLQRDL
jgi:hypothetical protein